VRRSGSAPSIISPGIGDCAFALDPALGADRVGVFWLPNLDPTVVLVAPAPAEFGASATLAVLVPDDQRVASDGTYFVARTATGRIVAVTIAGATASAPLAALVPLDSSFPARSAAALRLCRLLSQGRLQRTPDPLTPQRRQQLRLALRALDGRLAKATYRELAQVLFGGPHDSDHWKTHELRDRTIRLVRFGFNLMRGGYRASLRIPTRRK
jgi:hypothetical protein